MKKSLLLVVVLAVFAGFAAPLLAETLPVSALAPDSESLPFLLEPAGQEPITQSGNCTIRCDNGISVDGWASSCEECLQSAIANCNQQGTYGGWMSYPGCSYFW